MGGIARIMPSWLSRSFEEVKEVGRGVISTLEKASKVYENHRVAIAMSVAALCLARTSTPVVEISESLILFSLAGIEMDTLASHLCNICVSPPKTFVRKAFEAMGTTVLYSTTALAKGLSYLATRVPKV